MAQISHHSLEIIAHAYMYLCIEKDDKIICNFYDKKTNYDDFVVKILVYKTCSTMLQRYVLFRQPADNSTVTLHVLLRFMTFPKYPRFEGLGL